MTYEGEYVTEKLERSWFLFHPKLAEKLAIVNGPAIYVELTPPVGTPEGVPPVK
jgi:hypothetical protein